MFEPPDVGQAEQPLENAMTFSNDPNRPMSRTMDASRRRSGTMWGVIAALALLIVGGFMLFSGNGDRTTTASNTTPSVTQSSPNGTDTPTRPTPATPR
jgi:hypothetical protein